MDLETLRLHGTRSNTTFPLVADGEVSGALAFAMTRAERQWTEDEISGLQLVAQIFGHVISRRRSEERTDQLGVEIQQLLINLIGNATRAMRETPPHQRRVIIETRHGGRMVSLRVGDHGCGIPPGHLDRIFEPFHTTRPDGLGMGLAICRRIAESHGGRIVAGNAATGGADFTLSLPSISRRRGE